MSVQARGSFDVTMNPEPAYDAADGISLARTTIAKRFHGDLEGSSRVEMLSAVTPTQGSAAYVAIERVNGTLRGRPGSFVLQHRGTMTRGAPDLEVRVVPDSGTGELQGIEGKMTIDIVDGRHFYTFEYALAPADPSRR